MNNSTNDRNYRRNNQSELGRYSEEGQHGFYPDRGTRRAGSNFSEFDHRYDSQNQNRSQYGNSYGQYRPDPDDAYSNQGGSGQGSNWSPSQYGSSYTGSNYSEPYYSREYRPYGNEHSSFSSNPNSYPDRVGITRHTQNDGRNAGRGYSQMDRNQYRNDGSYEALHFGSRDSENPSYNPSGYERERQGSQSYPYGNYQHSYEPNQYRGTSQSSTRDWRSGSGQSDNWSSSGQAHQNSYGMGSRSSRKSPKNYTRSDERIKEDICDRLSDHWNLDPSEIEVSVKDGQVTLEGTVRSRQEKYSAESVADVVSGVKDIENKLKVQSTSQSDRDSSNSKSYSTQSNTSGTNKSSSTGSGTSSLGSNSPSSDSDTKAKQKH